MRKLVFILLFLIALPASAQQAALPDVKGFDHQGHLQAYQNKTGQNMPCERCHKLDKKGETPRIPNSKHEPCADSGCHKPWPIPPSKDDLVKYCLVCHPRSWVEKRNLQPFYAPYNVNPDHGVQFPHGKHAPLGAATPALCSQCHPNHGEGRVSHPAATVKGPPPAHETCASCHTKLVHPFMNECDGCHKQKAMIPARDKAPPSPWQVSGAFNHELHGKVAGDRARPCTGCHGNLQVQLPASAPLPRPTMQQCAGCHDGKTAFLAIGTTCTRCHKGGPEGVAAPPSIPVPPIRFPHSKHQQNGIQIGTCASCHKLDAKTYAALPGSGANHQPCATCHQDQFFQRSPKICGACHDDARPWNKAVLVSREGPTEFGHDFSHRAHVKDLGDNGFCQRCHQGRFDAAPVAKTHATCAPCHASEASPQMTECGGCHQLGQSMGALAPRDPSFKWYVRGSFDHQTHADDPRTGKATSCLLCHDRVAGASRLAEIGRPRMQQCDACHDGKTTFKTTGFGCARCHSTSGGIK